MPPISLPNSQAHSAFSTAVGGGGGGVGGAIGALSNDMYRVGDYVYFEVCYLIW